MLPKTFLNQTYSKTFKASVLTKSKKVYIFNQYDMGWEYGKNGSWYQLSKVYGGGVVLSSSDSLRYSLNHTNSYGSKMLRYYVDQYDSLDANSYVPFHESKIAVMMIHPVPLNASVSFIANGTLTMEEDGYMNNEVFQSQMLSVHGNLSHARRYIPYEVEQLSLPAFAMHDLEKSIKAFEDSQPRVSIMSGAGHHMSWNIRRRNNFDAAAATHYSTEDYISRHHPVTLGKGNASFVLYPQWNFHGNFSTTFKVCMFCHQPSHPRHKSIVFRIDVTVLPVNDNPERRHAMWMLPPIAYNLTNDPNDGFAVSQLASGNAKDPEQGSHLGIAVYTSSGNDEKYGYWQYFDQSNTLWKNLTVDNPGLNAFDLDPYELDPATSINVHLLEASTKIRFKLRGDVLWRKYQAYEKSFIGYSFWDMQDNMSEGNCRAIEHFCKNNDLLMFHSLL